MNEDTLHRRLRALGFPLLEAEETQDANLTLADMVRARDLRLWEGFPVVLANSAEKGLFDYNKTKAYLKEAQDRSQFVSLLVLSLVLYNVLGMKFSWASSLYKTLSAEAKKEYDELLKHLKQDSDFKLANRKMSCLRLKAVFNNYFAQQNNQLNDLLSVKEELGLEYSLSQVFSPKQKELFLKKLRGGKLTKTEKEYYSRTVKKKVLALANEELHRLSQRLLNSP